MKPIRWTSGKNLKWQKLQIQKCISCWLVFLLSFRCWKCLSVSLTERLNWSFIPNEAGLSVHSSAPLKSESCQNILNQNKQHEQNVRRDTAKPV